MLVGHPITDHSQEITENSGNTTPKNHAARQLPPTLSIDSDLILAMDRTRRKSIVGLAPRTSKTVFIIREFTRLIDMATDEVLLSEFQIVDSQPKDTLLTALEAARLGLSDVSKLNNANEDDVVDPYKQLFAIFEMATAQLIPATETISNNLRKAIAVT